MSAEQLEAVFRGIAAGQDWLALSELAKYFGAVRTASCFPTAPERVSLAEFCAGAGRLDEEEREAVCQVAEAQLESLRGHPSYSTMRVGLAAPGVLLVELHRPDRLNAMNPQFWIDCRELFQRMATDPACRCVLLAGAGRMFTAGLDLSAGGLVDGETDDDVARAGLMIHRLGREWQESFSAIEKCGKPVIACVHGACIGGGIEMIAASDIRFCTQDAYFIAAEVNIGMAADVGGLQRFPKLCGNQSLVRELCLSGRKLTAPEALSLGWVSRVCEDKPAMMAAAVQLAEQIAAKSPVATHGIKRLLNYSRDHSVEDALEYAIAWNLSMLQGQDMMTAAAALMRKEKPEFPNLPRKAKL